MSLQLNIWLVFTIFSLFASLKLFGFAQQQVPCYFIFGDSGEDNGNNNHLISLARSNYFPYGIDYPSGHTGRFTNGRTVSDFIAEHLGFEDPIQPYANTFGKDILKGVNYASGGAGILRDTNTILGQRISFDGQLQNHADTVSHIISLLGENAKNYLNNCFYLVRLGTNDCLTQHLPSIYNTGERYNQFDFTTSLVQEYSQKLKTLYSYGARKIAIFGIGPAGCAPIELTIFPSFKCNDETNNDARAFDAMLPPLVDSLNHNLIDARFIFINFTHMALTTGPETGITNRYTPCCIPALFTGLCIPQSIPCTNRDAHAFWDAYHTTEAFDKIIAKRAYSAATEFDCYPYDISTLAKLNL